MATSITNFIALASYRPADISVLVRGNHGIGKSEVVYQIAEDLGLPVMERRLSQMSEGDMIGLPWQETLAKCVTDTKNTMKAALMLGFKPVVEKALDGEFKVTSFAPPDWLAVCADTPHLIFLDEFNRATPEVMQAAFQLVLDRRVGSLRIHPDCRVYAAVNTAAAYQVNEMDPALLDRFAVVDLEPTVEDWLSWASGPKGKIHQLMIEFIRTNASHLEMSGKDKVTPGTVTPSRRSWARLDRTLKHKEDLYANPKDLKFFLLAAEAIGVASAGPFQKFCIENNSVTAEDIIDRWPKVQARIKAMCDENRVPELTGVVERLKTHFATCKLTQPQAANFGKFMKSIPSELVVSCWSAIALSGSLDNCSLIQGEISNYIVEVVMKGRAAGKSE